MADEESEKEPWRKSEEVIKTKWRNSSKVQVLLDDFESSKENQVRTYGTTLTE